MEKCVPYSRKDLKCYCKIHSDKEDGPGYQLLKTAYEFTYCDIGLKQALSEAKKQGAREAAQELRESLEDMCNQFAYTVRGPALTTGGLSALELAFSVLGWEDPHPIPDQRCNEPK